MQSNLSAVPHGPVSGSQSGAWWKHPVPTLCILFQTVLAAVLFEAFMNDVPWTMSVLHLLCGSQGGPGRKQPVSRLCCFRLFFPSSTSSDERQNQHESGYILTAPPNSTINVTLTSIPAVPSAGYLLTQAGAYTLIIYDQRAGPGGGWYKPTRRGCDVVSSQRRRRWSSSSDCTTWPVSYCRQHKARRQHCYNQFKRRL